jgi:hypothetical protein
MLNQTKLLMCFVSSDIMSTESECVVLSRIVFVAGYPRAKNIIGLPEPDAISREPATSRRCPEIDASRLKRFAGMETDI